MTAVKKSYIATFASPADKAVVEETLRKQLGFDQLYEADVPVCPEGEAEYFRLKRPRAAPPDKPWFRYVASFHELGFARQAKAVFDVNAPMAHEASYISTVPSALEQKTIAVVRPEKDRYAAPLEPLDPEELVICPFNVEHLIPRSCLVDHVTKVHRNDPLEKAVSAIKCSLSDVEKRLFRKKKRQRANQDASDDEAGETPADPTLEENFERRVFEQHAQFFGGEENIPERITNCALPDKEVIRITMSDAVFVKYTGVAPPIHQVKRFFSKWGEVRKASHNIQKEFFFVFFEEEESSQKALDEIPPSGTWIGESHVRVSRGERIREKFERLNGSLYRKELDGKLLPEFLRRDSNILMFSGLPSDVKLESIFRAIHPVADPKHIQFFGPSVAVVELADETQGTVCFKFLKERGISGQTNFQLTFL